MEQNHSKLRELFIAACDLPQHEQVALVDERCADDPEMRKELLSLLRSDGQESGIFCEDKTTNGIQFELDTVVDSELPDRIGQYEVKNVLGKGGMGIVYLAQQKNPRRDVAVKVIRSGMIGPELLKRFEFEAAVLGRLTHPGIANIYEAGVFVESTSGLERPFLAMEYVEGRSLRNYIDRSNPTQSERLRLLVQMCEAVHHAHQRGVIHRDLKPGNVVVKDNGQPSVLDFGVARATESDPDMPTLQTRAGQLVGTLRYMSPEQVRGNGLDVDTRSDVYSLGVIAYELLTGKLPYTVHAKDYLESAKVIAQENPRPMQLLDRKFRGDVNTIVLKALEKEPDRRYQSAKALGDDIQRYLDDQPIVARKSSWLEHRWRWCRRNQAIASLAALMGLMTVFGISGWIYLEKQRANVVAAAVTSISDSMNNARVHQRLANAAGSEVNPNRVLQVREIEQALASALDAAKQAESTGINEALRKSTRQLRDDLIAEASIARKLADQASFDQALQEDFELTRLANSSLTAYPANETDAQATETSNTSRFAVTTYEQLFRKAGLDPIGDDILQTSAKIKNSTIRASLTGGLDNWSRSILTTPRDDKKTRTDKLQTRKKLSAIANAVDEDKWNARLRQALNTADVSEMLNMANAVRIQSQSNELICWLGDALRTYKEQESSIRLLREAQQRHPADFWLNYELGIRLSTLKGQEIEGLGFVRVAVGIRPESCAALDHLCLELIHLKRYDEAELIAQRMIEIAPTFAPAYVSLSTCLKENKSGDPIAPLRKAIELDFTPMVTAYAHQHLGISLQSRGKIDSAIDEYRKSVEIKSDFADAWLFLANCLEAKGELAEAISVFRKIIKQDYGPYFSGESHHGLSRILARQGKLDAATAEYQNAIEFDSKYSRTRAGGDRARKNAIGENTNQQKTKPLGVVSTIDDLRKVLKSNPNSVQAHVNLGIALLGRGQLDEGIAILKQAVKMKPTTPATSTAHMQLGGILFRLDEFEQSKKHFYAACDGESVDASFQNKIAVRLLRLKDIEGKLFALEEGLRIAQKSCELEPTNRVYITTLGTAYYRSEQLEQAIEALNRSVELTPKNIVPSPQVTLILAMAYSKLGNQGQAKLWHQKATQVRSIFSSRPDIEKLYSEAGKQLAKISTDKPANTTK